MRRIMLLNAKGGCGKTTLATNLASYYANQGAAVALMDLDPQGCSLDWAAVRSAEHAPVTAIAAWEDGARPPRNTDYLIVDAPAAVHGRQLTDLVRRAETFIIPVLPSPMDIRAAAHFVEELARVGRVGREETRIAVVANRVRENTLAFRALWEFLEGLDVPFLTSLRDTQIYNRAAERGLGIFELPPYLGAYDVDQWEPVLKWLRSKRSVPVAT